MTKELSVSLTALLIKKDELKCVMTMSGVLSVMTAGITPMHMLSVANWDLTNLVRDFNCLQTISIKKHSLLRVHMGQK